MIRFACIGILLGIFSLVLLFICGPFRRVAVKLLQVTEVTEKGFVPRVTLGADLTPRKYLVFVPRVLPPDQKKRYPAILFLNGRRENGDDGVKQIKNNFGRAIWEFQETFPCIGIMPQCPKGESWEDSSQVTTVARILDEVTRDYPVDLDCLYVTGPSLGGQASFSYTSHLPGRFAASAPTSPVSESNVIDDSPEPSLPFWQFYNRGDGPFLVQSLDALHQRSVKSGRDFRSTDYHRDGHNAWQLTYRDPAFFAWLLRRCRSERDRDAFFEATNRTDVLFAESGALELECTFNKPLQITLTSKDANAEMSAETVGISLGPLGQSFVHSEQASTLLCDGSLFSRASIRTGNWTLVGIYHSGGDAVVEINGWPAVRWKTSDSDRNWTSCSVSSVPEFGVPKSSVLSTDSSDESQKQIRNRRYRPKLDFQLAWPELPFLGGDFVNAAANLQSQQVEKTPETKFYFEQLLADLKARDSKARDFRIHWKAADRFKMKGSISSLTAMDSKIKYRSSRPHREGALPSRSYARVERELEYERAISRNFKKLEDGVFPRIPFLREVGSSWMDQWEDEHAKINFEWKSVLDNTVAWARLTPEINLINQIDTLHMQAALLSQGYLTSPSIQVDFEQLEILPAKELVGGHLCVLARERRDDSGRERRFWIDLNAGGLIRRFQGRVPIQDSDFAFKPQKGLPVMLGNTLIEISYSTDGVIPISWTVASCQTPQASVSIIGHASSVRVDNKQ